MRDGTATQQARPRTLADLHDQLDFHGGVQWQLGYTDRRTRMRAVITEHLVEQVGGPVDDAWLTIETRRGGDEPDDLDHPGDRVDTYHRPHRRECIERADPRQGFALLRADLGADLAGSGQLSAHCRQLPGGVHHVARAHRRNIRGQRRDHLRQRHPELPEPGRNSHEPLLLLRALQVRDVLLTRRTGQHRHQLPAIGAPLVEDLLGGMRQQRNRGVLPCGRLAHDASLSVAFEQLWAARWPATSPWKYTTRFAEGAGPAG